MTPEVITHAPIQTRESSLDKQERYLALLAAEAWRHILSYQTGKEYPAVDVWNTVGTKSESDYLSHKQTDQSYATYHDEQIRRRYKLLHATYGLDYGVRKSLTDYEPDYTRICLKNVQELVNQGVFEIRRETFCHCPNCEYTITPSASGIKKCPDCGSFCLETVEKTGMFAIASNKYKERMMQEARVRPRVALGELKRVVCTLPPVYQLSKQRRFGIGLEEFGVDPIFVLDPKIALAMMGLVIKEMGIGNLSTLFQGIDSLANTVPYFFLVNSDRQVNYVALGMVPLFASETVKPENLGFYRTFLPLMMTSVHSGVNQEGLLAMYKNRNRTVGKYLHVTGSTENFSLALSDLLQEERLADFAIVKQVLTLFAAYKITDAFNLLREFVYNNLEDQIKQNGVNPIFGLFGLLYDQA